MLKKGIDYRYYHHFHSSLRSRLNRTAFDNYYACEACGSHSNLDIHIPNMARVSPDNRGSYMILCESCHKKVKKN